MELVVLHDGRITTCEVRLQIINLDEKVNFKHKNSETNKLHSCLWNAKQFYILDLSFCFIIRNFSFPRMTTRYYIEGRELRRYFCNEII